MSRHCHHRRRWSFEFRDRSEEERSGVCLYEVPRHLWQGRDSRGSSSSYSDTKAESEAVVLGYMKDTARRDEALSGRSRRKAPEPAPCGRGLGGGLSAPRFAPSPPAPLSKGEGRKARVTVRALTVGVVLVCTVFG